METGARVTSPTGWYDGLVVDGETLFGDRLPRVGEEFVDSGGRRWRVLASDSPRACGQATVALEGVGTRGTPDAVRYWLDRPRPPLDPPASWSELARWTVPRPGMSFAHWPVDWVSVEARGWYDARAKLSVAIGCEPGLVDPVLARYVEAFFEGGEEAA